MPFTMPESYRAYCTDATVRTAVEYVLSSQNPKKPLGLPADIDWKDLPAFHRAVLSAHLVRCEYSVLLIDLWDALWQPSLNTCEFRTKLEPWSVAVTERWWNGKLDTNTLWDESWFVRGFDIANTNFQIVPGVLAGVEEVRLSFCLWDQDGRDHTTGHTFGDDWPEQEIEDSSAWTSEQLAPIQDNGIIDLDPLHRAVGDALAAVTTRLQN